MRKSKGFTLVELIVTMAISVVVLALVGTTMYFLNRLDKEAIASSETMYKIQVVRDFVLQSEEIANKLNDPETKLTELTELITLQEDKILYGETVIAVNNQEISEVSFAQYEGFWRCTVKYGENQTYQFIVTKVTTQ